jgi:sugar O-acyltransferase (sialic acid O-acetyltransferase NeuD family)
MKNKNKILTIKLLGCSWVYMPVLFDVVYETLGTQEFKIYKNIPVEGEPELFFNNGFYKYKDFNLSEFSLSDVEKLVFGVTGPKAKYLVFNQFNEKYPIDLKSFINIIHPTSYIATSTKLNDAIFIEPGVIISSQTEIGNAVTIKRGVKIGHHNVIGDFCEFNPGVISGGNVKIGKACILGVGSVIKNDITIGENTFIGMGSVVTQNIPEGVIAYGNPCKVIKNNDLWKI